MSEADVKEEMVGAISEACAWAKANGYYVNRDYDRVKSMCPLGALVSALGSEVIRFPRVTQVCQSTNWPHKPVLEFLLGYELVRRSPKFEPNVFYDMGKSFR